MHTYIEHNISKFVPSLPGERLLESQPQQNKQTNKQHTHSNKHTFPINIAMGNRDIDRSIDSGKTRLRKGVVGKTALESKNLMYPSQQLTLILLLLLLLLLQLTLLPLLLLLMSQLNSLLVRENLEVEVF
jgi:hypothetical protein